MMKKIKNIIILEAALKINKELYDNNTITYKMYKNVEDNLLKNISNYNLNKQ